MCSEASNSPSVLDLCYLAMRSCACEDMAQRLASKLGSSDAAVQRFAAAAAAPAPEDREARKGAKRPPRFAAGSPDNPIMLSEVKVAHVDLCLLLGSVFTSTEENIQPDRKGCCSRRQVRQS